MDLEDRVQDEPQDHVYFGGGAEFESETEAIVGCPGTNRSFFLRGRAQPWDRPPRVCNVVRSAGPRRNGKNMACSSECVCLRPLLMISDLCASP